MCYCINKSVKISDTDIAWLIIESVLNVTSAMVLWHFMSFVRETRLVGSAVTFSPAWYFRRESGCWWGDFSIGGRTCWVILYLLTGLVVFLFIVLLFNHVHWRLHLVTLVIQNVSSSLFRNPWNCTKCPPLPAPLFTKYLWWHQSQPVVDGLVWKVGNYIYTVIIQYFKLAIRIHGWNWQNVYFESWILNLARSMW